MNLWDIYHTDIPDFFRDICATAPMQRLKGVGMNCGCEYTRFSLFHRLDGYSRYEHSVGTGLIVWHFTHDVKQTVAALLHDIASPVFAHVIDFMNGDHLRQESTEADTATLIARSPELQVCLHRLGLESHDVDDYHRYPIADNDSPRLSADRLEYTLGNVVNYGAADRATVARWYGNLAVGHDEEGTEELAFTNKDIAEQFAHASLRMSGIYIADEDRYAMQMLAELIRRHIHRGVLSEADLYTTEPQVIALLENDSEAKTDWQRFRAMSTMKQSPNHPMARVVPAKKRYIDPLIISFSSSFQSPVRMSVISQTYAQSLHHFLSLSFDRPLYAE